MCCIKSCQRKFDVKLIERYFNTYKFSSHDNNGEKVGFFCEYMNDWEKFNETLLPEIENFYSHLNMEDITDADYAHVKRVCKDFKIKNSGEYHDLYVQRDTLLSEDVFENFRNMCLKIYELDPTRFLSTPGLGSQATLKKTKVKLHFLTEINMLLKVEYGVSGGICHSIYQYPKPDNKYMKDYDDNKQSSYLQY